MPVAGFLTLECHVSHPAKAMDRAVLASGKLGQHNGLPVSIIVSTTLAELEFAAGQSTKRS